MEHSNSLSLSRIISKNLIARALVIAKKFSVRSKSSALYLIFISQTRLVEFANIFRAFQVGPLR